jgi:hypothetical protein
MFVKDTKCLQLLIHFLNGPEKVGVPRSTRKNRINYNDRARALFMNSFGQPQNTEKYGFFRTLSFAKVVGANVNPVNLGIGQFAMLNPPK